MNRYKVCVYAICKNEEKFVDSWMDSMSEADVIVVTDTGSTDGTVDRLKSRGAVVYVETIKPWRFDVARNRSLEHVPQDVDICICTDLDERLEPGWRAKLEAVWTPDAKMGRYLYNWSLKEDGSPDIQFNYFKVHTRNDYQWLHPVHECLGYMGTTPQITVFIPGMVLNHYPDKEKSRGSYLPLLELAVAESPENDRMNYYLGREYLYASRWQDCINTLKNYLNLKSAVWNEERCAAMRWIARSCYRLGKHEEAYQWHEKSMQEAPHMRDPYVECAQTCYYLNNWGKCFSCIQAALAIKDRSATYVNMGYCWDETPYDLGAIASYHLGLFEQSIAYAKEALSRSPNDPRLKSNLMLIELGHKRAQEASQKSETSTS